MRKLALVAGAATLIAAGIAAFALQSGGHATQPATQPTTQPTTQPGQPGMSAETIEKLSYGLGMNMASGVRELQGQGLNLDTEQVKAGFSDALAGKPKFTEEQIAQAMRVAQQHMMKEAMTRMQEEADRNLAAAARFLEDNRQKPGIVTTSSGLQHEVVTEGTGPSPQATDTVTVHYTGTLLDGTRFDSSFDRGEPATFQLDGVIPGWTEGLQLMKTGGKSKLYIPPDLAYGPEGSPPVIPPNSALVFEVELLGIQPSQPTEPLAPATQPATQPAR